MDEINDLSCNYSTDEVDITGSPAALLNLASFLSSVKSGKISLPDSKENEFYPNVIREVSLTKLESLLKFYCEQAVLIIEGNEKAISNLVSSIRSLVNGETARSGSHSHFEPSLDDYIDDQSWSVVIAIK